MKEFIDANGGIIPTIVLVILCINPVLSGLSVAIDKIKDMTPTSVDNNIAIIIHKVLDFLKAVLDILSANVKHE